MRGALYSSFPNPPHFTLQALGRKAFQALTIMSANINRCSSVSRKPRGLRFYFLIGLVTVPVTVVSLEPAIRFKVFPSIPQHWLILDELRFLFMVLILTNCSVQLKNQLTVSLPRECSADYHFLHANNSQSECMTTDFCMLQLFYVTMETERFTLTIVLRSHKLRKRN